MLQGLICMLLFVAIIILFIGYYLVFGHLVIVSFASVNGLSVVTNSMGVLRGATHKRRLQREGHSLLWVLRGETP